MTDASALFPVVIGVGIAVLTTNQAPNSAAGAEARRRAAMFTMAVQLLGFALVALALSIVGWYVENGRNVGPADLRVENWLIAVLAFLMVVVVIRNAWAGFVHSSPTSPWERGIIDRANTFMIFVQSVAFVVVLGVIVDGALVAVGASANRVGTGIAVVAGVLLIVFCAVSFTLRYLLGADPSPHAVTMSRRQQQSLLRELSDASGSWVSISVRAAGELEPALALSATVWATDRGWYWRAGDAYALARYHSWAGGHAKTPVAALHLQRVSVIAGKFRDSMRGMRITSTTRRLWLLEAWRSHRDESPLVSDAGSPERRAALVHIAYEQLQAAGLVATVRPERSTARQTPTNGVAMAVALPEHPAGATPAAQPALG